MSTVELDSLLSIINTGGVIAVLLMMLWVGIRGGVWPKPMVDRVMEERSKQFEVTAHVIGAEIREGIEAGVRAAVREGVLEAYERFELKASKPKRTRKK